MFARTDRPAAPEALAAASRRARELHEAGEIDAAVVAYRSVLERNPRACDCWCNLGAALLERGRTGEAVEVLRPGVDLCPQVAELRYNLGNALTEAGDHEGASNQYRAALGRAPGHAKAACALGGALLRLERFEEAAGHYGAALRRHPDDPVLYAGLGWALWRLRRLAAAALLRRAVALDPASSEFRWRLHAVLCWLGRYAEDERQLRAGLAREADSPMLLSGLAHSLIDQGRLDEALGCCRSALAIDPAHENARLARGRANFLAGR